MYRKVELPNERKAVYTHYDSIFEMDAAVRAPCAMPENERMRVSIENGSYSSGGTLRWYGLEGGVPAVQAVMRDGYPEGAALVDKLYDELAPQLPRAIDYRRHRVRADQGDSLDIHAVNRGALDRAWETVKRKARLGTGIIRIAVDIAGNCDVFADSLRWRGVAALALCRALVRAGYSVEIVAAQSGGGAFQRRPNVVNIISTTIKPRYAHVDTATLAAAVCLPGFFRYLGFLSIVKQADEYGKDADGRLGHSMTAQSTLPTPEKVTQICTPALNSRNAAIAWIKEAVALLQMSTLEKEKAA